MNRRNFLRLLSLAASTAVLDPEKLLWVPGRKTIFLPSQSQIDIINDLNYKYFYMGGRGGGKTWLMYNNQMEFYKQIFEKQNVKSSSTHS